MGRELALSVVVLVLAVTSVVHGSEVPFGEALPLSPQDGVAAVAVGDLDRDGWEDVAMALIEGDAIVVAFGGDSPTYLTLASGFDRACDVLVADVDGDGWLDVVGAKRGTGDDAVRWWKNPGASGGGWVEHLVSGPYFDEARGVDVGDLDGDGHLDLVAAGVDAGVGYVSWFQNVNGDGTTWVMRDLIAGFTGAHDAHVADVDGDGLLDVVAAAYDADAVIWLVNDGEITGPGYWDHHVVQTSFDGAICVTSGDLDGDGDLDLVAGAYLSGEVYWFANDGGDGTSWVAHQVTSSLAGVYSVQAVDLDGDGDLDVLAAGRLADRVSWFENLATFWAHRTVATGFAGARSALAVDFDGDGDLDVVAAAEFSDQVAWWPNLTVHRTAHFPTVEVVDDATTRAQTVAVADMDGDGTLDIVVGTRDDTELPDLVVWRQLPGGWSPVVVDTGFAGAVAVRLADLDRDGALDIVSYELYGDEVAWYENVGPATYVKHTIATSFEGRDLDVADLDCDGDLDVVAVRVNSTGITWWENTLGDGSAWVEHSIPTTRTFSTVRAGDVDQDGDIDLVAASFGTPGSLWALYSDLCNGGGWTATQIGDMYASDIVLGDFDRDGLTDLATVSFPDDTITVWLNTGACNVWERFDVTTTFDGAETLLAADLDLDGDLDLASVSSYSGELKWWANNGSGTSWTETAVADGLSFPTAAALGDLDRDGDLDLVTVEWGTGRISVYSNQGGQYRVAASDQAPAYLADGSSAALVRFSVASMGWSFDPDSELRQIALNLVDGAGQPFTEAQATAVFTSVQVWHDANGSGSFESWEDQLLLDGPPPMPAPGHLLVELPPGGDNPPISAASGPQTFFVVFATTADASAHTPDSFRVRLHPGASQMTSYVDFPTIRLRGEWWEAVATRLVTLGDDPGLLFADDFESGGTTAWSSTLP